MLSIRLVNGLLLASLLLGACAVSSESSTNDVGGLAQPGQPEDEPLPVVVVNSDPRVTEFVYSVLVGEIAGQRGQLPLSANHYLRAAQLSRDPKVAERATRMALFSGIPADGLAAARLWVELQPQSLEAHQVLALLLLRSGEAAAAIAEFTIVLTQIKPGQSSEEVYGLVATLLGREQNREAALAIMEQLVAQAGSHQSEALYAYSHLALRLNQPDKALAAVERVLRARPSWANALILKSRVLQAQGKTEAALNYLREALQTQPKDPRLRLSYARLLLELKRIAPAREQFVILARQDPKNADVLFALGVLYLQANQGNEAKQQFLKVVKLKQRVAEASFYLGQIAEVQTHYGEAINWYLAVKTGEQALDAQIRVAVLLARQGELAAARDHLQELETRDTAQAIRLVLVDSELLREAGRIDDALDVLSRAIDEAPGNADLLYARAMTAERLGRLNILEDDLKLILKSDPDHVQALNALGYTLADRTDRIQEAKGYIEQALKLRPNDFFILDSMGWVQYRLGNQAEAVRYLQQALTLKQDAEVAAHLGEVLWSMGNQQEARKVWRRALKVDPGARVVIEVMDRFGEH